MEASFSTSSTSLFFLQSYGRFTYPLKFIIFYLESPFVGVFPLGMLFFIVVFVGDAV